MHSDKTKTDFDAHWKVIDADGDGNLTMNELASHYGFNLDTNTANEMSDEQILEMLNVRAATLCSRLDAPTAGPRGLARHSSVARACRLSHGVTPRGRAAPARARRRPAARAPRSSCMLTSRSHRVPPAHIRLHTLMTDASGAGGRA